METVVTASPEATRLLNARLEELVAAELARLSRRLPALADDHLGLIEASLQQIINRLLPARGRVSAPPEAVAALFDLEHA
jgi:glutamyl-tRNA reductase